MRQQHPPALVLLALALGACSAPAPTTVTLTGTVRDTSGNPVPGALLQVNHGTVASSSAAGTFAMGTVATPYTLTLKRGANVVEYVGLTSTPPTIAADAYFGAPRTTQVSGHVNGPAYPLGNLQGVRVGTASSTSFMGASTGQDSSAFTGELQWWGDASTTATIGAAHYTSNGWAVTAYHAAGSASVSATAGAPVTNVSVAASAAIPASNATVTLNSGPYSNASLGLWSFKAGGVNIPLSNTAGLTSGGSVLIPNAGATLAYDASTNAGARVRGTQDVTPPGTVTITVPTEQLTIAEPVQGQTAVSTTPTIRWNAIPNVVSYRVTLEGGSSDYTFVLPGSRTLFTVPNYASLGAALKANTTYYATVEALRGEAWDVNSIASGYGVLYGERTKTGWTQFTSASVQFKTAP